MKTGFGAALAALALSSLSRNFEVPDSLPETDVIIDCLKSTDGCITIAKCKSKGYERIVFESGANTGTALTEYGVHAGLETYFFLPEENLLLLRRQHSIEFLNRG